MANSSKNNKRKKKEIRLKPDNEEFKKDDEKSGQYGGIPPRDLKKNLGCG